MNKTKGNVKSNHPSMPSDPTFRQSMIILFSRLKFEM